MPEVKAFYHASEASMIKSFDLRQRDFKKSTSIRLKLIFISTLHISTINIYPELFNVYF